MQICREWVNTGSGKAEEGPQLMIGDFNLNRIHGAFYALKTIAREGGGGGGGGEGTDFTPIAEAKSDVDVRGCGWCQNSCSTRADVGLV